MSHGSLDGCVLASDHICAERAMLLCRRQRSSGRSRPAGVLRVMRQGLGVLLAGVLIAGYAFADDRRDAAYLANVVNMRLETQRTGVEAAWLNPDTGSRGTITILENDDSDPQKPCRTYRRTTERPGEPTIVVEGRACRIEPGLWQRTEGLASTPTAASPAPAVARTEPPEPPPLIPPPPLKPDPNVFYASVPTPSDY